MKRCPRCGNEHDGEGVSPSKQHLLICGPCYKQNEIDRKKPEARRGRLIITSRKDVGLIPELPKLTGFNKIAPSSSKPDIKTTNTILTENDPVIRAMEDAWLKLQANRRQK